MAIPPSVLNWARNVTDLDADPAKLFVHEKSFYLAAERDDLWRRQSRQVVCCVLCRVDPHG